MAKKILSRLDDIEAKIAAREPLNKFDAFWMARRLRLYEKEMMQATEAIEQYIPGTGELDPLEVGELVSTYMMAMDFLIQLEQKRLVLNRRPLHGNNSSGTRGESVEPDS